MPTNQQYKQIAVQEERERQQQCAVIGKQVMQTLGQPSDLHMLQVCRLWEEHYRVNVLVGLNSVVPLAWTVTVCVVWPGVNVRVPLIAV